MPLAAEMHAQVTIMVKVNKLCEIIGENRQKNVNIPVR